MKRAVRNHASTEHGEHLSCRAGADQDVDAGDGEEEPGRAVRRRSFSLQRTEQQEPPSSSSGVEAISAWGFCFVAIGNNRTVQCNFGPSVPLCPTSWAACWAFQAHTTHQLAFLRSDHAVRCRSDGLRDPRGGRYRSRGDETPTFSSPRSPPFPPLSTGRGIAESVTDCGCSYATFATGTAAFRAPVRCPPSRSDGGEARRPRAPDSEAEASLSSDATPAPAAPSVAGEADACTE